MRVEAAMQILLGLLGQATQVSQVIHQANAEGRDLTDEEVESFRARDKEARSKLQEAIDSRG